MSNQIDLTPFTDFLLNRLQLEDILLFAKSITGNNTNSKNV